MSLSMGLMSSESGYSGSLILITHCIAIRLKTSIFFFLLLSYILVFFPLGDEVYPAVALHGTRMGQTRLGREGSCDDNLN